LRVSFCLVIGARVVPLPSQSEAASALRTLAPTNEASFAELDARDGSAAEAAAPSVHALIRSGHKPVAAPSLSSAANQTPPTPPAINQSASDRSKGPPQVLSMVERRLKAAARARVRPVNPGTGAEFSRTREAGGVGSTTRPKHGLSAQHLGALGANTAFDPQRAPSSLERAPNLSAWHASSTELGGSGDSGNYGSEAGDDGYNGGGGWAGPASSGSQAGRRSVPTVRERRASALAGATAAMRQVVAAKKGRVVGARCTLNYKGLGTMYPGRIARDRGDGTYDVDLNVASSSSGGAGFGFSGDLEARVPGEWVLPDYVEVGRAEAMDTFRGMFSGEGARAEDPFLVVFEAEDDDEADLLGSTSFGGSRTDAELSVAAYHAHLMGAIAGANGDDLPVGASFGDVLRGGLSEQDVVDLDLEAKLAARSLDAAKAAAIADAIREKEALAEAAKANAAGNDAKVADVILTFLRRSGVNVLKVTSACICMPLNNLPPL
jgi:hypothetical protein